MWRVLVQDNVSCDIGIDRGLLEAFSVNNQAHKNMWLASTRPPGRVCGLLPFPNL